MATAAPPDYRSMRTVGLFLVGTLMIVDGTPSSSSEAPATSAEAPAASCTPQRGEENNLADVVTYTCFSTFPAYPPCPHYVDPG
mmetsp:Transcript_40978/g.73398  ORF Transcript_40978/g.73398 Transcript_40978/m.73398 type:complete len:84 (+) Transcript_40978:147-398(+)